MMAYKHFAGPRAHEQDVLGEQPAHSELWCPIIRGRGSPGTTLWPHGASRESRYFVLPRGVVPRKHMAHRAGAAGSRLGAQPLELWHLRAWLGLADTKFFWWSASVSRGESAALPHGHPGQVPRVGIILFCGICQTLSLHVRLHARDVGVESTKTLTPELEPKP